MSSQLNNIIKIYGRQPTDLDDLAACIIKVIESQPNTWFGCKKKVSNFRVAGLAWNISHKLRISGKQEFTGRVWIRYADKILGFGSDPFDKTMTRTGTGGGGSYNGPWDATYKQYYRLPRSVCRTIPEPFLYSWDYSIDLDNFPALTEWVEAEKLFCTLAGQKFVLHHQFNWTDPAFDEADKAFLESTKDMLTS